MDASQLHPDVHVVASSDTPASVPACRYFLRHRFGRFAALADLQGGLATPSLPSSTSGADAGAGTRGGSGACAAAAQETSIEVERDGTVAYPRSSDDDWHDFESACFLGDDPELESIAVEKPHDQFEHADACNSEAGALLGALADNGASIGDDARRPCCSLPSPPLEDETSLLKQRSPCDVTTRLISWDSGPVRGRAQPSLGTDNLDADAGSVHPSMRKIFNHCLMRVGNVEKSNAAASSETARLRNYVDSQFEELRVAIAQMSLQPCAPRERDGNVQAMSMGLAGGEARCLQNLCAELKAEFVAHTAALSEDAAVRIAATASKVSASVAAELCEELRQQARKIMREASARFSRVHAEMKPAWEDDQARASNVPPKWSPARVAQSCERSPARSPARIPLSDGVLDETLERLQRKFNCMLQGGDGSGTVAHSRPTGEDFSSHDLPASSTQRCPPRCTGEPLSKNIGDRTPRFEEVAVEGVLKQVSATQATRCLRRERSAEKLAESPSAMAAWRKRRMRSL